jgi:hypothetical protein
MQPKIILLSYCLCWIVLLAHHGEGLFFTSGASTGAWVFGGSTAAGGANAAVLLGGLVVAKAVGFGVLALLLVRYKLEMLQICYNEPINLICYIYVKVWSKKIKIFIHLYSRGVVEKAVDVVVAEGIGIVESVKLDFQAMKTLMTLTRTTFQ